MVKTKIKHHKVAAINLYLILSIREGEKRVIDKAMDKINASI